MLSANLWSRRASAGSVILAFFCVSEPTLADDAVPMTSMIVIGGRCSHLIVLGADKTPTCQAKMLNTTFADGRSGFYFVTSEDVIITFSGMGSEQIKPNDDTAIQPVDMIIVGKSGHAKKIKAVGKCRIENPFKGSVPLSCQADTAEGIFEGDFMTDGRAPDVRKF